jgi:hypothetical protein
MKPTSAKNRDKIRMKKEGEGGTKDDKKNKQWSTSILRIA